MKKLSRTVLVPLILIPLAAVSLYLLLGLQTSLDAYRPSGDIAPTRSATAVLPAGVSRASSGVVLVVVDGLRDDTSQRMPYLNQLRQSGAYGAMKSGEPSFSKPSYTVLSSGAWQEVTGIVLNSSAGPTPVDTVFRSAKRSGLKVAMDGHVWWEETNGPSAFTTILKYGDDESHSPGIDLAVRDRALSLLAESPDLALVQFTLVDTWGHSKGAASQEYLNAALDTDGYIKQIAAAMDLSHQTLIVVADHGHLNNNNGGGSGHGGWEKELTTVPFVMVGAGVKPGALSGLQQVDIAPTIAALLGIGVPADAQGRILWDGLTVPAQYRAAFDALGQPRMARVSAAAEARSSRLRHEQLVRCLEVLAVAAAAVGLLIRLDSPTKRVLGSAATAYPLVYWLVYAGLFRDAFSLAAFPDAEITTFVRIIGVPAAISLTVLYLGLARSRSFEGCGGLAWAVETVTMGAMLSAAAIFALCYVVNGSRVTWLLPDFRLGFLQLSALMQFSLAGFLAWSPALIASAISGRSRRHSHGAVA